MSRVLKILLVVLVLAGVGVLSLPAWLGVALHPVLRARGITFERYERAGYAQFRLHGVRYARGQVEFTAGQIQAPTPLVWLVQRLRGRPPQLTASHWKLRRQPNPHPPPTTKTVTGVPDLQTGLQRVGPRVAYWLPRAHLSVGELSGFGPAITIAEADWRDLTLKVDGLHAAGQVVALTIVPAADGSVHLTANTADQTARLQLAWSGLDLKGEVGLWNQTARLSARFPAQGWQPAEASLTAENWDLPAARVKLGAPYTRVLGGGRLLWREGAFDLSIDARATPEPDQKAPPLEARVTARGNLHEVTVTTLAVTAPFATASLDAPITFSLDRPPAGESARLRVQADLAKMPWFDAQGRATGEVTVTAGNAAVRQDFKMDFTGVVFRGVTMKSGQARGALRWPRLELAELKVQLDDDSSFASHGAINWQTRELDGVTVAAKLAATSLAPWLPGGITWTAAEVHVAAEGPLAAPRHRGNLKVTALQRPPLNPVAIEASWQGSGTRVDFTGAARAADSALEAAGVFEPRGVELSRLQFAPDGQVAWQLAAPARVAWSPAWQIDALAAAGPAGRLSLKWRGGPGGGFEIVTTRFSSAWLHDWIAVTGPAWELRSLQASGRVVERALVFDAGLTAQIAMAPRPAEVSVVAHGDARGIELKELRVVENERVLTQAAGRLPMVVTVDPTPRLALDETAPLELTASTEPDSPLWATLTAFTGLQLEAPSARADLQGTLRQPRGELQVSAARLSLAPGRSRFPMPELADLALALRFDREAATLANFSAKLDGQPVQASGRLPMGDEAWQQLWRAPAKVDWRKAEARVEIPEAELAPLARRFPALVTSQGRLRARVELAPGGIFSGSLHLDGAATRPLPVLGSFQDITAELALNERVITVQKLAATLGGEPVTLDGTVTLVPDGPPRLALTLKGSNLPLVRTSGMLLRSDVDLHADTDAAGRTRLTGGFAVRDCLVLANVNLRTLLPTGRRGVALQPPYFAVPAEPFRDWPLAVDIRAPGAVRVRTTVYHGVASGLFHLDGTLGEPRAVGQLTVDQGQVLFPFATFRVQQGAIRLRESDPHRAVVSLNATSQRRDYQLRLEMTGELPAPNVSITSTPALEAADALLMVMTGQAPAGDNGATKSGAQRFALLGAYLSRGLFQDLGFNGEDRLEFSAGEQVSRSGRETYDFEYKLGEHWSLTGEYDEFDAFNAGVKWRVYTEEGAPLAEKK